MVFFSYGKTRVGRLFEVTEEGCETFQEQQTGFGKISSLKLFGVDGHLSADERRSFLSSLGCGCFHQSRRARESVEQKGEMFEKERGGRRAADELW